MYGTSYERTNGKRKTFNGALEIKRTKSGLRMVRIGREGGCVQKEGSVDTRTECK